MTTPFAGLRIGDGGVRFNLFGFPVRIQLSFFLIVTILGLTPGATVASVVIWTSVAALSILWHELGHAFAARRLGSQPTIDLYSFGGLTHWQPRRDATRWHLISVALAGPVSGMVLGGLVALAAFLAGGFGTGHVRFSVIIALWINLGWGLVNLLPVLPLDGGHVMAELLPGSREQRWRRAAYVSVAVGVVATVALFVLGFWFGAVVFVWAIATNIAAIRAPVQAAKAEAEEQAIRNNLVALSQAADGAEEWSHELALKLLPARQSAFKLAAVETAALSGHGSTARRLLEQLPGQAPPALYALVVASETFGLRGVEELEELFHRSPDRFHSRWLAYGLHAGGRLDEMAGHLHRVPPQRRGTETVEAAAAIADWADEGAIAAELRSLATA